MPNINIYLMLILPFMSCLLKLNIHLKDLDAPVGEADSVGAQESSSSDEVEIFA